jgi:hypothetical protein
MLMYTAHQAASALEFYHQCLPEEEEEISLLLILPWMDVCIINQLQFHIVQANRAKWQARFQDVPKPECSVQPHVQWSKSSSEQLQRSIKVT